MTKPTFFKSKKFLILIPVLGLGLLTLGYFSWVNYSQNNLFQPLLADETDDVVVIDECDLVVKYKKFSEYKSKSFKEIINLKNLYYFTYAEPNTENFGISIMCSNNNFYTDELNNLNSKADSYPNVKYNSPSPNFCEKIKINLQVCNKITPLMESKGTRGNGFYFKNKDFYYYFDIISSLNVFQPNSLAPQYTER